MKLDLLDEELSKSSNKTPQYCFDSFIFENYGDITKFISGYDKDLSPSLIFKRDIIGNKVVYSYFRNVTYNENVHSVLLDSDIPVLNTNLPYEIFSKIKIPNNIISFDKNSNKYVFEGYDLRTILNMFDYTWFKGIRNSLYMQIHNGSIVSMSIGSYVMLLFAIYLKLPKIPVSLFILDDNQIDILRNKRKNTYFSNDDINLILLNIDERYHKSINEICNPYFIFYDKRYDDKSILENIVANGNDDIDYYEYYHHSIPENNIEEIDNEVSKIQEESHSLLEKEMKNDINSLIKKYQSNE